MMSTSFLKDLPSFNKENFSHFQPNSSQLMRNEASDSFYHCRRQSEDAREVVNQKFNIVLKYLQKPEEFKMVPICKKREISQVLSSSHQADEQHQTLAGNIEQNNLTKKRKLLETMLTASGSSEYQKMNS